MKQTLTRLYDHLEWADRTVLESLGRAAAAPRKALEVFAHVLGAEKLWLDRINGTAGAVIAVWPKLTVEDCASLAGANAAALREVLEAAREADLDKKTISYTNSKGEKFSSTLGDILLHVAVHGAYHRGQVALAVRTAGGEPVNTDYIHYVRSHRKTR